MRPVKYFRFRVRHLHQAEQTVVVAVTTTKVGDVTILIRVTTLNKTKYHFIEMVALHHLLDYHFPHTIL